MRALTTLLALFPIALLSAGPSRALTSPPIHAPDTVAISHARVVDSDAGRVMEDWTVIVVGGRIAWAGPSDRAQIPDDARTIDAAGRYLVPGLADMHVHLEEEDLPLLLANGVTLARDLNGAPDHLRWRDEVAAGARLGPTLVVSSPLTAGTPQRYHHELATTPEQGRELVREYADAGYDCVKVYDGLGLEVYRAIADEARRVGLPLVGHVPADVGLHEALAQGQASIEHVEQILYRIVDNPHDPDPAVIPAAVAEIAAAGTTVTPTLAVMRALSLARTSPLYRRLLQRPEVAYAPAWARQWWASLAGPGGDAAGAEPRVTVAGPADAKPPSAFFAFLQELTRQLHAAGVPLLAGTDTPNPQMVAGFSLHDELETLVNAGLTPAATLRAATAGAASFLGTPEEFGSIVAGARADLVLLDGDPLQDVSALRSPEAVMVRGRWLGRDELDAMLAEVAAARRSD